MPGKLSAWTTLGNSAGQDSNVEIQLDNYFKSKIYTSGSRITGKAVIRTSRDLLFDNLDISFAGVASTCQDSLERYRQSIWRFLTVNMPIHASHVPSPKILKAGEIYTVPFHFVVPHRLPIGACNHYCCTDIVKEHHLRLPPTVGLWGKDDQSPPMAHISYTIHARISQKLPSGLGEATLIKGHRLVSILPASSEDAALDISPSDVSYKLRAGKVVRVGLLQHKTGKLSISASQPKAVMLSADGRRISGSEAHLELEFTPFSGTASPPVIKAVAGKLHSTTFYSTSTLDYMPNFESRWTRHAMATLGHRASDTLINVSFTTMIWKSKPIQDVVESSNLPMAGPASTGGVQASKSKKVDALANPCNTYKATLDLPFEIPYKSGKILLPTFHSCLISRTYVLQLTLSITASLTEISVRIPLQIGVDAAYDPNDRPPSFHSVSGFEQHEVAEPQTDQVYYNDILPGYDRRAPRVIGIV